MAFVSDATAVSPSKKDDKAPPKPSKITKQDWAKVELHLKDELEQRKRSDFRKNHEQIWKQVDRQIAMQPMLKVNRDGSEQDPGWHNVIELGELSKASENISSDVVRIIFPKSRYWFDPHTDIQSLMPMDAEGNRIVPNKLQDQVDGRLRSMMTQQHNDFGLKKRVGLSVKEALHHGSYVVEVEWEDRDMIFDGDKRKTIGSPTWIPHSMWNAYPDPSPSVIGTDMFYTGTMFIDSYMPRAKAERWVKEGGEGFMPSQWKKVAKDEHMIRAGGVEQKTKDVKVTKYWGDINIDRADESLYFPNHKVILMNGTIVYMAPNKTPYPPIIYDGYERMDVRDPYYMSPIIKQSPMQKLGSTLTNKFMDGVELHIEPPIVYDGNDPDFVLNGGPVIAPGVKVSTKGTASFKEIQIGDLKTPLEALQMVLGDMKEKLGRPGKPVGDRATKAEVDQSQQNQEVSVIDFIDKLEGALRSFLYMQHHMNTKDLTEYAFYSPEMKDPDFIRIKNADIPKDVHFEVVGARGVLGEQERAQKFTIALAFAAGNPLFASKIDVDASMIQIFQDAGVKNPERFILQANQPNAAALAEKLKEAMQALQKLNKAYNDEKQKTAVKLKKIEADQQAKHAKLAQDAHVKSEQLEQEKRRLAEEQRQFNESLREEQRKDRETFAAKMAQIEAKLKEAGLDFHKAHLDREAAKDKPEARTEQ